MTADEFNNETTIKAFALAFKNKYNLEPVSYDKQPTGGNGKRPSPKKKPVSPKRSSKINSLNEIVMQLKD